MLDTSLITMLNEDGYLSDRIINRFKAYVAISMENGADCIQLTCSAFNDVTSILEDNLSVPVFRSDEGMINEALRYKKVGIVSTFQKTPVVLSNFLKKKSPEIEIEIKVNTCLMEELEKGNKDLHDKGVLEMIRSFKDVEVVILAQYSIAHIAEMEQFDVPIITAPKASLNHCIAKLMEVQ